MVEGLFPCRTHLFGSPCQAAGRHHHEGRFAPAVKAATISQLHADETDL
jgi:hypothetical protein